MASDPSPEQGFTITSMTDPCENSDALKAKAERCLRLAAGVSDKQASDVLKGMARGYEEAADRLGKGLPHV